MININLWTINKTKYHMEIEKDKTIGEIKRNICEKIIGEKTDEIKICYKKKVLNDNIKIGSLNIGKNEKMIVLSPKIKLIQRKISHKINEITTTSNVTFEKINSSFYKILSISEEYYKEKMEIIKELERRNHIYRNDLGSEPIIIHNDFNDFEIKVAIPC